MREREVDPLYPEKPAQVDLKEVALKYLRYWYLFVLGGALGLGVAFVYLRYVIPKYSISATLLIKDEKNGPGLSESAAFSDLALLKSSISLDNEMVTLTSESLMERVLTELDLRTTYYMQGPVQDQEIYGAQLPFRVIVTSLSPSAFSRTLIIHPTGNNGFEIEDENQVRTTHQFGQQVLTPYGAFTVVLNSVGGSATEFQPIKIKFQDVRALAAGYASRLVIGPVNNKASVLVISLVDEVPQKGVDIINKLIEVYNKEAVEDKNVIAAKTIGFIDERLKYLTTELVGVEKDVEKYKRQNELTDVNSQAQQYLQEASGYNKQVAELGIQYDVLESIQRYLTKQGEQYRLVPSSLNIEDPTLLSLIKRFNELQLERERMLRTTEVTNVIVQSIDQELGNLRTNILENLENIKAGLVITRNNLQRKSGQFGSRIRQVPVIERQLIEITRRQEIKHALYLYLLQKREESALSLAATVSNTRTIDTAAASGPVSPNRPSIWLNAMLVGLALPFAAIYLKGLLNTTIQTRAAIEKATPVPVIGEIAHTKTPGRLMGSDKAHSPVSEAFRHIRANLHFLTASKASKVLLVTSSMSGEGKTFCSINLALSLAASNKRVALVDFDLRKPSLLETIGLPNDIGVTDYILNDFYSEDLVLRPSKLAARLMVIGTGIIPTNADALDELLVSPRVGQLLESLRDAFDYVIIDAPPIGLVADAFILAPYVDSMVYVIRMNHTLTHQLTIVNDLYAHRKFKQPFIVLNDVKAQKGYGYAYQQTYGYGGGTQNSRKSLLKA